MADNTAIEWTDATWNPITGCSVVSPGCTNCYAMRLAGTRLKNVASRKGLTTPTKAGPVWTGEVRFNEAELLKPLSWRRPRKIFACAHGDLFHPDVPDEWIDRGFAIMAVSYRHIYQVLTKRSDRMRRYLLDPATPERIWALVDAAEPFRDAYLNKVGAQYRGREWPLGNVWLGVSAEDQSRADERIPDLLATPAAVRWLSAEPLLGPLDLRGYIPPWRGSGRRQWSSFDWPKWVPQAVREEIESFWRPEIGRGPDEWMRGARANGQPPLGTQGRYRRSLNRDGFVDGYFVPAWNSIGRVVANGEVHVVSEGRWQSTPHLDWVVAGGESGPGARPMHPDWVRSLRDQCAAADVAFLFKQWGTWLENATGHPITGGHTPGSHSTFRTATFPDGLMMNLVGKKAAGRLLDGVLHDAYPEVR